MALRIKRSVPARCRVRRGKPGTGLFIGALLSILVLSGCQDPFALEDLIDGPDGKPLTISPTSVVLTVNSSITVDTSGGIPPYTYSVVSGTGSFTGSLYTAPAAAGTESIRVEDSAGNSVGGIFTIDAGGVGLAITPSVQTIYSGQTIIFTAVGGTPPYSFEVTAGPSGTTTVPGAGTTYSYTAGTGTGLDQITLTDSTTSVTADITVNPAPVVTNVDYEVTTITDFSVPGYAETGTAMTGEFSVTNNGSAAGSAPLNWTIYASTDGTIGGNDFIVASGSQAGLGAGATVPSITANGFWPSVPGSYNLILYLASADDLGLVDNQAQFTGSVDLYAPLTVSPSTVDVYVGQEVTFTPAGGSGIYTYAISTVGSEGAISPSFAGNIYTAGDIAGTDIVTVNDTVYPLLSENATVTVTVPPLSYAVDYSVGLPEILSSTLVNGEALSGNFTLDNIGSADGGYPVDWTVYASANMILGPNDFIIDSGSTGALTSSSGTTVLFSGYWPVSGTPYYLFVEIAALDDNTPGDDKRMGAANVLSPAAPADIEYSVANVTDPGVPVLTGSALSESFDLTNGGGDAGVATVYWTAYLSNGDATLDIGTDIPIASGTSAALGAGGSTTGIPVNGYWPQTAGTWYLIVSENASDEITAGEIGVSAAVTVNDPAVDYKISNFTVPGTPALTGTTLSGSFQIENISLYTGTDTIYWTAYVSTDATITPGVDPVVDSGVITADLAGGALSTSQTISGSWPFSANDYYVLVKLYSGDDINSLNDEGQSGLHVISQPDIEYKISSITAVDMSPDAGSAIAESFILQNTGADAGTSSLNWYVYLSDDDIYDAGGDLLIDIGSVAGGLAGDDGTPGSGADQTIINVTASWPESAGTWYLIVRENADDEGTAGDWLASSAFSVQSVVLDVDYSILTPPSGGSYEPASAVSESFSLGNLGTDAGGSIVTWTVYLSTDIYFDGSDTPFDSGSIAPLGASPANVSVPIDGIFWPGAGTYYLIVRTQSTDDLDLTNNSVVSSPYLITSATPGVSDYTVAEITMSYPTDRASSPIREGFTVTNIGENAGPVFDWDVYVSPDNVLDIGSDTLVDSATGVTGLANGASLTVPAIDGAWPDTPNPWYLIVDISAVDGQTANNTVARGPYTIELPPDYSIVSTGPRLDVQTEGGNIDETLASVGVHEFTIEEINGTAGALPVSWSVHFSTDTILDAGDTKVANGAVSAPSPVRTIQIPGSTQLPSASGYWYMLISVSSGEDVNASNNVYVSAPLFVWTQTGDAIAMTGNYETDTTEDDIYVGDAEDFAILLNPGDSVQISGLSDEMNPPAPPNPATPSRDSFLIYTGSASDGVGGDVVGLRVRLIWDTNGNDQDIYVFNAGGTGVGSSTEVDPLREPGPTNTDWLEPTPILPGTYYYIDVLSYASGVSEVGDRYFLYVEAF